jgi:hypothetical protein
MNAESGRCTSADFSGGTADVEAFEESPGREEVDDDALPMDATVDARCNPPLGRPIPILLASALRVDSARVWSVSSLLKPMLVFGRSGGGILSFSSADAKVCRDEVFPGPVNVRVNEAMDSQEGTGKVADSSRGGRAVNKLLARANLFFVGDGDPLGAAAAETGLFFVGVFVIEALAALALVGFANDDILVGEGIGIFDGDADGPACEGPSPFTFRFFTGLPAAAAIGPTPNENNFFCVGAK